MISCILLSAGENRRFGSPKGLASINGEAVIHGIQKNLTTSMLGEIIIVLGAYHELIEPHVLNHKKVQIVYNKDYKFGQTSSFQRGVSCISRHSTGIMLYPVDCPFILTSTVDKIISLYERQAPAITVPTFQGRRGHPPIFNIALRKKILGLPVVDGINTIFRTDNVKELEIPDAGIAGSFNTPEELVTLITSRPRL